MGVLEPVGQSSDDPDRRLVRSGAMEELARRLVGIRFATIVAFQCTGAGSGASARADPARKQRSKSRGRDAVRATGG